MYKDPLHSPLPVTGWSILNALGASSAAMIGALCDGRSGITVTSEGLFFEAYCGLVQEPLAALPGTFRDYDCRQGRLCAALMDGLMPTLRPAIKRWGRDRIAIVLATSTGGIASTEKALQEKWRRGEFPLSYQLEKQHNFYGHCELLKKICDVRGPSYVISTACSSSTKVFAAAQRMIEADLADAVIVGGIDSICLTTLYGFRCLGILSDEYCRPFGAKRRGLNIGEGGALLLLERRGEAKCHLLGTGESNDAHHMSSPHPQGRGAVLAMTKALHSSGRSIEDIDYINAHGTGTQHNDASEALAIRTLFEEVKVPVASTKGYTGHMLGAAGATEAVFSCLALEQGFVPKSVGATPVDSSIEINIRSQRLDGPVRTVMSNSFGFGGSNACAIFGVLP